MRTDELVLDDVEFKAASTDVLNVEQLIAQAFPRTGGQMHVRRLWSRNGTHFYRVNWWRILPAGASYISDSRFVAIDQSPAGLQVRELTRRTAA